MNQQHLPPGLRLFAILAFILSALAVSTGPAFASTKLSQAQAETQLRAAGILWSSSGHCVNRNRTSCTSFEQLNSSSVDGIIKFKQASGCPVTITGGTEIGHNPGTYSHYAGYKLDISLTSCVTTWITNHYPRIANRAGDNAPQYRSSGGNIYANESSHWDITFLEDGARPSTSGACSPAIIQYGNSGTRVKAVQYLLQAHGVSISADGVFGRDTESRVKSFQRTHGLGADGVVGPATWRALYVTVQYGSNGSAVRAVQSALLSQRVAIGVDGLFGHSTESTVRSFQNAHGLSMDGVVGPGTWCVLVH